MKERNNSEISLINVLKRLCSIARKLTSMSFHNKISAWLWECANLLKTCWPLTKSRIWILCSPSHAFGASVVVTQQRMVFHTRSSSQIGGKVNSNPRNSHPREQCSTTTWILSKISLKTGANCLIQTSFQQLILARVSNPTLSQLLRPFLLHS